MTIDAFGAGRRKKVVFIAELSVTTCSGAQRLWALEQCGATVTAIDIKRYRNAFGHIGGNWARLTRRFELLYDQDRLESDIVDACARTSAEWVWFEWPRSFSPNFLRRLKALVPEATLISFQDDNPFGTRAGDRWQWRSYFRCVPLFDLHLVKRPSDVENLSRLGAKQCRLWMHGIYRPLFRPPTGDGKKIYPISFVGTCFDDRAELFEHLIGRCNLPVHVFGSHWRRRTSLPRRFPSLFHGEVTGESYADVIRGSGACIGLVSTSHHDEWSLRTFEIPGCATAFIAQRTPLHERLFRENSEALLFSSPEDCALAVRGLLDDPKRASDIGNAGFQRCVAENRFIDTRMRELVLELG